MRSFPRKTRLKRVLPVKMLKRRKLISSQKPKWPQPPSHRPIPQARAKLPKMAKKPPNLALLRPNSQPKTWRRRPKGQRRELAISQLVPNKRRQLLQRSLASRRATRMEQAKMLPQMQTDKKVAMGVLLKEMAVLPRALTPQMSSRPQEKTRWRGMPSGAWSVSSSSVTRGRTKTTRRALLSPACPSMQIRVTL